MGLTWKTCRERKEREEEERELLAMEKFPSREGRRGREEDFPPPASSRDGSHFRRQDTRGERRGKMSREREEDSERERRERERRGRREGGFPSCLSSRRNFCRERESDEKREKQRE